MAREDVDMDLGGHLNELRHRVIISLVAVVVFAVIAFILKDTLIDIIFAPSQSDFVINRWLFELSEKFSLPSLAINQEPFGVVNTKMAGQFNLHIKASFVAGIVCGMPVLLWQLWAFIRPALDVKTQRKSNWLIPKVLMLFLIGLCFGYFLISPLAVNFLANYSFSGNIKNFIEVSSYLSTVLNISIAASLIFELPYLVLVLARLGLVTSAMMKKYRKLAIVIIFIFSAIITPPDVFSQILIALPFYLLYELSISLARREENRKAKLS